MGNEGFDRRTKWVPNPRPEWMSILNALGEVLDGESIVPLTASSLIETAVANTGLSDFGGDRWREHFEILMKAIAEESKLHLTGRLLTRYEFLLYLEARLRIVDAYKRHPEIDSERIDRPVFITGYGRSGTTILFEVLSQDPQFRVATKAEAMFPVAVEGAESGGPDPRIAMTRPLIALLDAMTPEFKSQHKADADLPVESLETEYSAFLSDVYPIIFQVPTYGRYLAGEDITETIEWQKTQLKLLQWQKRAKHWLMKSPSHLPHLRKILNVFPDMRVIFTHRDPIVTADSVVSVMGTLYWLRTDDPWGDGSIEAWSLSAAEARATPWDDIIDMIEGGTLAKGNYANFQYANFMVDPIAEVRKIYADLELELSADVEQRMLEFLKTKTKGKFGKHEYESTPAEILDTERSSYRRYEEFFGVAREL